MSHVRRKRPHQPIRSGRKKETKKQWLMVFILILLIMGTIIGIIFVIIASP